MSGIKPLKIVESILTVLIAVGAIIFFAVVVVVVWIGHFHNDIEIFLTNLVLLVVSLISYGIISDYNSKN